MKLSADTPPDAIGRISIEYLDSSRKIIKSDGIKHSDYPTVRDGKFHRIAFLSEAPANAAFLKISLESRRAAPGKIWFDNISIKTIK